MDLTGTIKDLQTDFLTGQTTLSLYINEKQDAMKLYDEYSQEKKLSISIKKHRQKRSLDSNAYAWTLIDKLAEKLNIPKETVYKNAIREIGGVSEIVCVQNMAVEKLCNSWMGNGIGWQTETMPSKINGCTNVILYYGSSTYDTAQMSRLIDIIVEECKAQGIETKTPDEIAKLVNLWGGG